MSTQKFQSIDDYLTAQEPAKAVTLRSVIDGILADFPELESKLSWNVPTIHRRGKYVAGFAAYKKHLTVSAWSPRIIESFKERLDPYVTFKNCFQVPVNWDIDRELVRDLIGARLKELDQGIP